MIENEFLNIGFREMDTMGLLLRTLAMNPPRDFCYSNNIRLEYNPESDTCYACNEDNECVVLEDGKVARTYFFESICDDLTLQQGLDNLSYNPKKWSLEDAIKLYKKAKKTYNEYVEDNAK